MWISRIDLQNVRVFETARLDLSRGINILVGPNNAGKSTILLPILSLQEGLPSLNPNDVRIGKLKTAGTGATFTLQQVDGSLFPNNIQNPSLLNIFQKEAGHPFQLTAQIPGRSEPLGFAGFSKNEPANFIYPFTSKRKVTSLRETVTADIVHSISQSFENLNAKIDRVSSPGFQPAHGIYVDACEKILGFQVHASHTQEGKRAVYTVRNMSNIPLVSMGEGIMNILGLMVHLSVAENRLFIIEEPENDLHPKALKALLDLISERASVNQFIITTHSNIVVKKLGGLQDAKVFEVSTTFEDRVPTSQVREIGNTFDDRRRILESLGYELNDAEIWAAWLLLEESSAERLIREFFIPWFIPRLSGQLRTFSARSLSEVAVKFRDFNDLFVFLHLQPIYRNRAWVLIDGGDQEREVINKLKEIYQKSGWSENQFQQLSKHDFEEYYPSEFKERVSEVLNIRDKHQKRTAKKELFDTLIDWIALNAAHAKQEFEKSAQEVIALLTGIANALTEIRK